MSKFLSTPNGNTYNIERVGGVKAFEENFLILGTGPDEVLDYVETSPAVANAWRDATRTVLTTHSQRRNSPLPQPNWMRIAAAADFKWACEWAAENGWDTPVAGNPPPLRGPSGHQPLRRGPPPAASDIEDLTEGGNGGDRDDNEEDASGATDR